MIGSTPFMCRKKCNYMIKYSRNLYYLIKVGKQKMKISAVKIYNIRSFLEIDNYLELEDTKTAIIGVNESGKSNILEAIGKLNFTAMMGNYYTSIKNLLVPEAEVKILVELSLKDEEMQELHLQPENNKTLLTFMVGKPTIIEGALRDAISHNEVVKKTIEFWDNHKPAEFYNLTNDNRSVYNNAIQLINKCSTEVIDINSIDVLTRNFKKDVDYKECISCINDFKGILSKIYMMFPMILYKQWDGIVPIRAAYLSTEAIKELADKNSSFYKFVRAAGIESDEMKRAFELPEGNARYTLRYKLEKQIENNVCKEFKKFYEKDELNLMVKFEANKLLFNVMTGDMIMSLGERSNGLRWYFGLFIELMAMDYKNRDVLYLLDEPGVFLHVNAQKELLSLFNELCEKNGQVVYTTHLPYMLDTQNIYNIRRVEKDDSGQSHIFNRVYAGGLELSSRQETLTPLIQAMGCDMKHSIDMASRMNIITEGITDRMYLEAGVKSLDIKEQMNFIPCNGASAIPNIVSILIGWGCNYRVLLDYDSQGFTQYKKLIKAFGEEIKSKIVFVVDEGIPEDVNDKSITTKTIEAILSVNDTKQLEISYDGTEKTKTLAAIEFRSKVFNNDLLIDEVTSNNYQQLFTRLGIKL